MPAAASEGPVGLVTGSTSGIGAEVVRRLAADGWRVVVNSVRSVDAGRAMVDELGEGRAHYVQGDVSVLDDARRLVRESVERSGSSTCWSTTPARPSGSRTTTSRQRRPRCSADCST